jgi:hypothetical protein
MSNFVGLVLPDNSEEIVNRLKVKFNIRLSTFSPEISLLKNNSRIYEWERISASSGIGSYENCEYIKSQLKEHQKDICLIDNRHQNAKFYIDVINYIFNKFCLEQIGILIGVLPG